MVRITLNMGSAAGGTVSGTAGSTGQEEEDWFYVGTGGVGGLTQTLLGRSVPGV